MPLLTIPLNCALPALQAYLTAKGSEPLDPGEAEVAAERLERCVRTAEALVAFGLHVAGRPSSS